MAACLDGPAFAAIANLTVPEPDPVAAPTIVTNGALLIAAQVQPAGERIPTANSPPAAGMSPAGTSPMM
jgi:hypothetical protein